MSLEIGFCWVQILLCTKAAKHSFRDPRVLFDWHEEKVDSQSLNYGGFRRIDWLMLNLWPVAALSLGEKTVYNAQCICG